MGEAWAQGPGIKRTDLQRHDISTPGRQAVQVRVDFAPGAAAPKHSHPGEEIVYAIEGSIEYQLEGKPPVTLKAGEVLFIPAGWSTQSEELGAATLRSWQRISWKKGSRSARWFHLATDRSESEIDQSDPGYLSIAMNISFTAAGYTVKGVFRDFFLISFSRTEFRG